MKDHHWRICRGDTTKLTAEQCESYRQLWDRKAKGVLFVSMESQPPAPPQPTPEPVGDELAKIFEWLGQVKSGTCKCKLLQDKMNAWRVKGCRENYHIILEKLEKAAFERNIPMPRAAFMPFLEAAIWRAWLHGIRHKPQ